MSGLRRAGSSGGSGRCSTWNATPAASAMIAAAAAIVVS
jgi:hypothetical protein